MKNNLLLSCILSIVHCTFSFSQLPVAPIGFASLNAMSQNGTTGGQGGGTVTVTNYDSLYYYATHANPYIIYVSGIISDSVMVPVTPNKTIIGLNCNAVIDGFGFHIIGSKYNIIIQNLFFQNGAAGDAITIKNSSHHIWIDHCEFSNYFDGLVDITNGSNYCEVSWNIFRNHQKTSLVGANDTLTSDIGKLKTTFHHNWFDGTAERHPRVRFGEVHIVNNYYTGVTSYCVGAACQAKLYVESNYFLNSQDPLANGIGASAILGEIKEVNNIFNNCTGGIDTLGAAFNPSVYYAFSVDSASNIPSIVQNGAGVCGAVTSVQEQSINISEIIVTPNPSLGIFSIGGLSADSKITVFNSLGQKIFTENPTDEFFVVDMAVRPDGIYFLSITTDNKLFLQKIIIQK